MFIATLSNGKMIVEGKDVANFDECPDGITSLQLTMPHVIQRKFSPDKILQRQAILSLGRYDKYYSAKEAVANVMSFGAGIGQPLQGGQGTVTHEIIAGIDIEKNLVVHLKLNITTGDVVVDVFPYDWWIKQNNINPSIFKKGTPKK